MAILVKAPSAKAERIERRIALIDADVVAYYSSFGLDDMPRQAAETKCWQRCNQIEQETQASHFRYYLSGPPKENFRNGIARLKRYKGDRYDEAGNRLKDQPKWLQHVRQWLISNKHADVAEQQEADDTISIAARKIRDQGYFESCISTVDKDLGINPGWFHNQMKNTVEFYDEFGEIHMEGTALKGHGLKFFYAQLLMGDPTDWIPGLPKVTPWMKEEFGIARLGGCGPKAAFCALETAKDIPECQERVKSCYRSYWEGRTWSDWREPKKELQANWEEMLTEQGRLLWMRQKEGELWTIQF
jgi:5'-3' exonuclease